MWKGFIEMNIYSIFNSGKRWFCAYPFLKYLHLEDFILHKLSTDNLRNYKDIKKANEQPNVNEYSIKDDSPFVTSDGLFELVDMSSLFSKDKIKVKEWVKNLIFKNFF